MRLVAHDGIPGGSITDIQPGGIRGERPVLQSVRTGDPPSAVLDVLGRFIWMRLADPASTATSPALRDARDRSAARDRVGPLGLENSASSRGLKQHLKAIPVTSLT
jgi:hypothetical protein